MRRSRIVVVAALCVGCGSVGELLGVVATDSGVEGDQRAESSAGGGVDAGLETGADGETGTRDTGSGRDAGDGALTCDPSRPFGAPQIIAELQSSDAEGGLRLLPDELTGFFWSTRPGGPGTANLYITTRPDRSSPFGNITLLRNVNVPRTFQLDPSVIASGLLLAFRSDREGGAGGDDLYSATRANIDADFSGTTMLSALDTAADDVQPFLLPDGSGIYFSSNRGGDYDIYRAAGVAGAYRDASPVTELNSVGASDADPVVSADGLTIFFSSTRPGGAGQADVWTATRRDGSAPFGTAADVTTVNSTGNDNPTWLSVDGCRLYMSSDAAGSTHLYLSARSP